jgi:hypothetical protein
MEGALGEIVAARGGVLDEENLVSCAGLVAVMALAERAGLSELVGEKVETRERADSLDRGEPGGQGSPRSWRGWPQARIPSMTWT